MSWQPCDKHASLVPIPLWVGRYKCPRCGVVYYRVPRSDWKISDDHRFYDVSVGVTSAMAHYKCPRCSGPTTGRSKKCPKCEEG